MRYKITHYAESLFESLKDVEVEKRIEILKNFLKVLRRNGDYSHLNHIVRQYEKVYLQHNKQTKIYIETPEPASIELKRTIQELFGKKAVFSEKTNSHLLAGIVLLINDSVLIDASARTRLEKLFVHTSI